MNQLLALQALALCGLTVLPQGKSQKGLQDSQAPLPQACSRHLSGLQALLDLASSEIDILRI